MHRLLSSAMCHYIGEITDHYFQVKVPEHRKVTFGWAWALVLVQQAILGLDYCLWITSTSPGFFFDALSSELMGMKSRS